MKTKLRLITTIGRILLALAVGVALATGGAQSVAAAGPTGQIDIVGPAGSCAFGMTVTALSNGNYVVASAGWDNAGLADVGAATWGNGATGTCGVVSAANSLVGGTAGDYIGLDGVTALSNGNYVVVSTWWDNGGLAEAGAVTWGSGTTGLSGQVSAANSLVGSTAGDMVGGSGSGLPLTALDNGGYVVFSYYWDNGPVADAGAVTWGDWSGSTNGPITAENSVRGTAASGAPSLVWAYDHHYPINQLVVGRPADNIVTLFVLPTGQAVFLPAVLKNAP